MTNLYLVRHGETDWNREGKYTGQSDIPLNEAGRRQAQKTAEKLREYEPQIIYSSDLMRAYETAQIISRVVSAPIMTDKRLREINQGDWEGMHVDEIKDKFNGLFKAREKDPFNVSSPQGETMGEVYQRVYEVLKKILADHPQDRVVITAHGVVLAIIRLMAVREPIDRVFEYIPENAVIHHIQMRKINDQ